MTAYIANHQKKKNILEKKEALLKRMIANNATKEKLLAAAEDVKNARIRVMNVQRSQLSPNKKEPFIKIDAKIKNITDTPLTSILAEFGVANYDAI